MKQHLKVPKSTQGNQDFKDQCLRKKEITEKSMHRTAPTIKVLGSTCQSRRISIRFTKPQLRQSGITPKQKNKPMK